MAALGTWTSANESSRHNYGIAASFMDFRVIGVGSLRMLYFFPRANVFLGISA